MVKKNKSIDKNIGFAELLEKHPESVEVLMNSGMHCIGCPASMFETLEDGALAHGIDADKLVKEINKKLSVKEKKNNPNRTDEDEINNKWERIKNK